MENPVKKKSTLYRLMLTWLWLMGLGGWLGGGVRLGELWVQGFNRLILLDAIFNLIAGALVLLAWRLLGQEDGRVIPLFALITVGLVGYGLASGRGFNLVFATGGLAVTAALIGLERAGELGLKSDSPGDSPAGLK